MRLWILGQQLQAAFYVPTCSMILLAYYLHAGLNYDTLQHLHLGGWLRGGNASAGFLAMLAFSWWLVKGSSCTGLSHRLVGGGIPTPNPPCPPCLVSFTMARGRQEAALPASGFLRRCMERAGDPKQNNTAKYNLCNCANELLILTKWSWLNWILPPNRLTLTLSNLLRCYYWFIHIFTNPASHRRQQPS